MNSVSIYDLKKNLAHWAKKAAKGEDVHITRHNKPYVVLCPENLHGVRWGKNVGRLNVKATIKGGLNGLSLKYLVEDRDGNGK